LGCLGSWTAVCARGQSACLTRSGMHGAQHGACSRGRARQASRSAGPPWRAVPDRISSTKESSDMAKGTHRQWPLEGGWRHIVAFVLAVLAIAPRVWAAPGDLDPSFRGTGVARTVFRGRAFGGFPVAVVRQDDGKLVVAGLSSGRNYRKYPCAFPVVRYLADGTR